MQDCTRTVDGKVRKVNRRYRQSTLWFAFADPDDSDAVVGHTSFATAAYTLHHISVGSASLLHIGFNSCIHFEIHTRITKVYPWAGAWVLCSVVFLMV